MSVDGRVAACQSMDVLVSPPSMLRFDIDAVH